MSDLIYEERDGLVLVTLNRPKALNALTLTMARELTEKLALWAGDPAVQVVVVQGAGERAFCAGGDIMDLYNGRPRAESIEDGNLFGRAFFAAEYRLNRAIKVFPKPYIALIDGITMGGGVGLSLHGSHRVATENTLFAMPETGIGLFPDVGASYALPRLPKQLGLFLGLTGWRIKAADCLFAGIANHAVEAGSLESLVGALVGKDATEVDAILQIYQADFGPAPLVEIADEIESCFGQASLEEALAALQSKAAQGRAWAEKAMGLIEQASPTSLALTWQQLQQGRASSFDDCMIMEYRLSQACLAGHDFYEGVRAAVVDKDRQPCWRPQKLADVDQGALAKAFAPLEDQDLTFDEGA